MMDAVANRWSLAGSLGLHVLALLFLLLWGSLSTPVPLPKPEAIRLTIVNVPAKPGPAAAPGPAKRPQLAKAPAAPAPVVAKAQPAKVPPAATVPAHQSVSKRQPTTTRQEGDWHAALAKRQAELQAKNNQRLASIAGTSGNQLMVGSGGGDAGEAGGELAGRQLLREVRPVYPRGALADRVSGRVLLSIVVGADGSVSGVSVQRSSGDGRLDEAARAAISQWRFAPLPDGLPAADARGTVPVSFWYRKG